MTATQQTDVGRQALAAVPLIRNDRIRGVSIFADSLDDVEANVTLIRGRILTAGALALILAAIAGYFAGAHAHRPHQAPGAGGAEGGGRRLLQPDPRGLRRRDRPARGRLRRHAAPARPARHRAQAVHRPGVARAAHADLLARRLPRAARGRGARRRDAGPVPRAAARPGRPHAQALHGAARPLPPRVGRAGAPARADGPAPARPRGRGGVHARRPGARRAGRAAHGPRAARGRVRPRARRPGDADPARQRVRPHAHGHVHPGFGRARQRACHP